MLDGGRDGTPRAGGARGARRAVAAIALLAALAGAPAAGAAGGDWPSYGHDLRNTRHQPAEHLIGPEDAGSLQPAWRFSSIDGGGDGGFQSTAVVAGGRVLAATTSGWVFALDADDGRVRWRTKLRDAEGGGPFALAVADGRVHVTVSGIDGPFAAALDEESGELLWRTGPLGVRPGLPNPSTFASAVVHDGVVFFPETGPDSDPRTHSSYFLLDAATGEVLAERKAIPDEDFAQGYAGAGIWATAAVDERTGYAYVGTSNPDSIREHERTNAIVKIDLDRDRPTFGDVVASYKGTPDDYAGLLGYERSPVCRTLGPVQQGDTGLPEPYHKGGYNLFCGAMDLDFGASPNLIDDGAGGLLVGELQKSGVYHAAHASDLSGAWQAIAGTPPGGPGTGSFGNASSSAYDGRSIYVVGAPGLLSALDPLTGRHRWVAPVADGLHYQPVAVANGVVYTIDSHGFLLGFDARDGRPLLRRQLAVDVGDRAGVVAGGVSIARNTVFAVLDVGQEGGGWIVAYRLSDEVEPPPPPRLPSLAPPPGASGAGSIVVTTYGSYKQGYVTPVAVAQVGGTLVLANTDFASHDVVSDERGPDGRPLFSSKRVPFGQMGYVTGLDRLEPGRAYGFHDSVFGPAKMHGVLHVLPRAP